VSAHLNQSELARRFGVSLWQVRWLDRTGLLPPSTKRRGHVEYDAEAIRIWEENNQPLLCRLRERKGFRGGHPGAGEGWGPPPGARVVDRLASRPRPTQQEMVAAMRLPPAANASDERWKRRMLGIF
jgi:hypothetical protein